jgi:hypothetical protein
MAIRVRGEDAGNVEVLSQVSGQERLKKLDVAARGRLVKSDKPGHTSDTTQTSIAFRSRIG